MLKCSKIMNLAVWFAKFQTLHYKNVVYLVTLNDIVRFIFELIAISKVKVEAKQG